MIDDYPTPALVFEIARLFPNGDSVAIAKEVQYIQFSLYSGQLKERHLSVGSRKILAELRAVLKAIDGLGAFAHQAVRHEMRAAWAEGYDWFTYEDGVRKRANVHLPIPDDLPIGFMTIHALQVAVCAVANKLEPARGRKGYGEPVRKAARDLVALYCRHTGCPKPYYNSRTGSIQHGAALSFAHGFLALWCGAEHAPAAADIVWMLT